MAETIIQGGCLCGAVRYEASGEPYNVTHCHCADCRRSSGAAFVTWVSFKRRDLAFTQGNPREFAWANRSRSFCARCGTPLTFTAEPNADEIDVTVCSFDNPNAVSPADHTWTEDRLTSIIYRRMNRSVPATYREVLRRASLRDGSAFPSARRKIGGVSTSAQLEP